MITLRRSPSNPISNPSLDSRFPRWLPMLAASLVVALFAPLGCGGDDDGGGGASGGGGAQHDGGAGQGGAAGAACEGTCETIWQCPGGAELLRCDSPSACSYCVKNAMDHSVLGKFPCQSCGDCENAFKDSDQTCGASGSCAKEAPLDTQCASKGLPSSGYFCAASNASIPTDCVNTGSAAGIAYCCP